MNFPRTDGPVTRRFPFLPVVSVLLDLIEQVLDARTGTSISEPRLAALDAGAAESGERGVATEQLAEFAGDWRYPPASLGLPEETRVTISVEGDHMLTHEPGSGTFKHYLQADGTLFEEDSHRCESPAAWAAVVRGFRSPTGLFDLPIGCTITIELGASVKKKRADRVERHADRCCGL